MRQDGVSFEGGRYRYRDSRYDRVDDGVKIAAAARAPRCRAAAESLNPLPRHSGPGA